MSLDNRSLTEIIESLSKKEITSVQLLTYYLEKIEELNEKYNGYLFIRDKAELLQEAQKADEERANGSTKKLLGIPFAAKDSFMALRTPTTGGDLYLESTKSEYNATVIQKLLDQGAILIGKTNMDSWGFGSSTQNSSYGVTKNPFDTERVVGGSSGGSAAGVALDMCAFSLGEDTGGSIRNPANYGGIYGLKPTYGRISRFGCIAYGSSLDSIGFFTRSAQDLGILFEVLKGEDGKDMTLQSEENIEPKTNHTLRKKFAYSYDFIPEGIDLEVKQTYLATIENFKQAGYEAVEVKFPALEYAIPTYYITAMSEASTNLARYQGTRYGKYQSSIDNRESEDSEKPASWEELFINSRTEGFNQEAKRRIVLGAYTSSEGFHDAYYKKAQKIRNIILEELNAILDNVDFILSPVTPTPAPKIGEKNEDPIQEYLSDIYTVTANLAGIPAISFPCAMSSSNLPIGMQIMGRKFDDEKLIQIVCNI